MTEQKRTVIIATVIWWFVLAITAIAVGHLMYDDLAVLGLEPSKLAQERGIMLKAYGVMITSMIVLYFVTIPIHRAKDKSRKEKFISEMMISFAIAAVAVTFTVMFIGKAGILVWLIAIASETIINAILVNISHNIGRWVADAVQIYKEGGIKELLGEKVYDLEDPDDYEAFMNEGGLSIKGIFKALLGFGDDDKD